MSLEAVHHHCSENIVQNLQCSNFLVSAVTLHSDVCIPYMPFFVIYFQPASFDCANISLTSPLFRSLWHVVLVEACIFPPHKYFTTEMFLYLLSLYVVTYFSHSHIQYTTNKKESSRRRKKSLLLLRERREQERREEE